MSHETALLELQHSELQASVEIIDAALGGKLCQPISSGTQNVALHTLIRSRVHAENASTDLRPHEFKGSSFVTPQTCAVCASSVWGKGLKCTKCDMAVHPKCELKVSLRPLTCATCPCGFSPSTAGSCQVWEPTAHTDSSFSRIGTGRLRCPTRSRRRPRQIETSVRRTRFYQRERGQLEHDFPLPHCQYPLTCLVARELSRSRRSAASIRPSRVRIRTVSRFAFAARLTGTDVPGTANSNTPIRLYCLVRAGTLGRSGRSRRGVAA